MQNERKRILQLVESGVITAEEAIGLLEKLSPQKESTQTTEVLPVQLEKDTQQDASSKKVYEDEPIFEEKRKTTGFEDIFGKAFNDKDVNKKMDEFMHELKQDLSHFGTRMAGLMGTTLSKLKDLDIDTPFGEKVEFNKTYAYPAGDVNGIELDVANGKIEVIKTTDATLTVDIHVKTTAKGTEEETIAAIVEDLATLQDQKLMIHSANKFTQVKIRIAIPEKHYDVFIARLLSGGVSIEGLDAKLIKVKTYNGIVRLENAAFNHAELQSSNGSIEARQIKGEDLEVETANGRIYIDGEINEVEAESFNGHVVVTTSSADAHKVKARTMAGTVEIYVPKTVAIDGQIFSNFGKADVGLSDVTLHEEADQLLLKSIRFNKELAGAKLLKIVGESRTGTVLVRYTTK
ncbi:DUF4097 family beta strand repeat-containing protein [Solibacillus sp. FSL K6-1523]|uniref:DUF4097 family beta strand repeat-containing protein n=1 Tax=Solibacillus sp. FSL K6-1523 TaxID=2921471 RepID=UPI0030F5EF15